VRLRGFLTRLGAKLPLDFFAGKQTHEGLAEFGHSISLDLCNQRPLAVDELRLAEGMTCFATSFGQQGSLVISLASVIIHNGARWREGEREREGCTSAR